MSGFAVIFHSPNRVELDMMIRAIHHRGPYVFGKYENEDIGMAQNYLKGDVDGRTVERLHDGTVSIPVYYTDESENLIGYDGQVGNQKELRKHLGILDGPFKEERLLLHLYRKYGHGMLEHLDDAIFSFAISDGKKLFAARDLLGIKTLFYGKNNGSIYLSSELKGLKNVTDDVNEFPPGHYMDEKGQLKRYGKLPKEQPQQHAANLEQLTESLREIIRRSLLNRVSFNVPTASLLSGGIDSSVVAWLASNIYKEKWGDDRRLKTFALGVGESEDIKFARIMADFLKSEHYELMVDVDCILKVLPDVIYYLESFDPSLVRSAVSNYLISKYAKSKGVEVLLSGEGGDEIFCGYQHLKASHTHDLFKRQMECLGLLHNNAALRLDRMNLCNSIRVVAPLVSGELLKFSMAIKPGQKIASKGNRKVEKWIFRKAYEKYLPKKIVWRTKKEFSQGSGTAEIFQDIFNNDIDDAELEEYQHKYPFIRSKEELSYFKLFKTYFGADKAVKTVGQWINL